jgi:transcriptional regulator with XRE-family HTH domain
MSSSIGENISLFRKLRGLTQEQLGRLVGVSTPAVSKWETGVSLPDLMLLSPIARALGTNPDTLLDYQRRLDEKAANALVEEVGAFMRAGDSTKAVVRMRELLLQYPDNPALQFPFAAMLVGLPSDNKEQADEYRAFGKTLLETVLAGDEVRLHNAAAYLLAGQCVQDGEYDRAETLLARFDQAMPDVLTLKATLREKRGEIQKAKELLQVNLFVAYNKMLGCIAKLAEAPYCRDATDALAVCDKHEQLAALIGYPYAMTDALRSEIYLREGDGERALEYMERMVRALLNEPEEWGGVLTSEMKHDPEQERKTMRYLYQRIYRSFLSEESFLPYRELPAYGAVAELLRQLTEE